jgi:DNA uptake protein ComE-like DNA-binding protein
MADQLLMRLDPNTASTAELAAIPSLGEKRAAAIVEFREKWEKEHPGQLAFVRIGDLYQIKGVGPATGELLGEYLRFGREGK